MAWTVSAQNNVAARAGSGRKLDLLDLETLCTTNSWLSDQLIDYGVTECPSAEGGGGYGQRYNGVFWLEPVVVVRGRDRSDQDFRETLGRDSALSRFVAHLDSPLVTTLPKDASVLLFPVNRDNTHWSLLAFYKETRDFVHYDSLETNNEGAAAGLVRKLAHMGYLSRELPITAAPMQRQADGYNCGVFVTLIARLHMAAGRQPDADAVAAIDSAACDRFRTTMLRALSPLVEDVPAAANIAEGGAPGTTASLAAKEEKLVEQIAKVEKQLQIEEEGPIALAGVEPCPLSAAGGIAVTFETAIDASSRVTRELESAHVVFTVGSQKFGRKAVKQGRTWVVEAKFLSDKAFDVEVEARVEPDADFEPPRYSETVRALRARERREVKFTFTQRPDRKIYAQFLVQDVRTGPRPFPQDFDVEFALDHGSERVRGRLDANGACEAVIPWSANALSVTFSPLNKWRKLNWAADAAAGTPARLVDTTERDKGEPLVLPPWTWEHQGDEWESPAPHLAPDGS